MREFSHRCSNMYEDDFTDLPGKSNDGAQREDTDHSRVKKVHEKIDGERLFAVLRQKSEINEGLLSGKALEGNEITLLKTFLTGTLVNTVTRLENLVIRPKLTLFSFFSRAKSLVLVPCLL